MVLCLVEGDLRAVVGTDGIVLLDLTRGQPDLTSRGLVVVVLAIDLERIHGVLLLRVVVEGVGRLGRGGSGRLLGLLLSLLSRLLSSLARLAGDDLRIRLASALSLDLLSRSGTFCGNRLGRVLEGIRTLVLRISHEEGHGRADLRQSRLLKALVLIGQVLLEVASDLQMDRAELRSLRALSLSLLGEKSLDLLDERGDLTTDAEPGGSPCSDGARLAVRGLGVRGVDLLSLLRNALALRKRAAHLEAALELLQEGGGGDVLDSLRGGHFEQRSSLRRYSSETVPRLTGLRAFNFFSSSSVLSGIVLETIKKERLFFSFFLYFGAFFFGFSLVAPGGGGAVLGPALCAAVRKAVVAVPPGGHADRVRAALARRRRRGGRAGRRGARVPAGRRGAARSQSGEGADLGLRSDSAHERQRGVHDELPLWVRGVEEVLGEASLLMHRARSARGVARTARRVVCVAWVHCADHSVEGEVAAGHRAAGGAIVHLLHAALLHGGRGHPLLERDDLCLLLALLLESAGLQLCGRGTAAALEREPAVPLAAVRPALASAVRNLKDEVGAKEQGVLRAVADTLLCGVPLLERDVPALDELETRVVADPLVYLHALRGAAVGAGLL